MPGRRKAPLEDLVNQRALADPRTAGNEDVDGTDLMGGFADVTFDHAQDILGVEAVERADVCIAVFLPD